MLILHNILSQEIVQRLGWTLLHFIWQAAAVALILTILLRLLRKSTANLRYIIACLSLALIVLLPIITIKLVPVSQPLTAANFTPAPAPTVLPIEGMPAPDTIVIAKPYQPESVTVAPAIPLKQRAVDTLEPALPYIVSGWLIGVFGLSIWHLGGWTQLQRLKRRMVKQVDTTLLNKLKVLIQKLKVKQTVQLMESALIQIPTVVGWINPVILLPTSAITGLNTEQLEAIIAHELAHIKRFDYLINILQTVVEILGFYHPAVWWISHKIRAERENCCDDMAVSISGDRLSYAGALASMEEIRAAGGKLAVAATGGNLFRRICRLLGKDSTDNTGLSWVPAATAILLIIALAIPTTLALTNKTDSLLTETKTDVHVEDDILIATVQDAKSPVADSEETTDTQIEAQRILSSDKLKKLGLAVAMYANDNNKQLPDTLEPLKLYIANEQDYLWLLDNTEYALNDTKYLPNHPVIPVAYDKTQKETQSGANVLFMDGHVEFLTPQRLSKLDMKRAKILIEAWFLAVNNDFIENINHNADSPDEAKELLKLKSQLLVAKTSCPTLNDKNISLLLKAVRAHKDSKILAAPQVICWNNKTAEIAVMSREYYHLKGYKEPNDPPEKFQEWLDKTEEGIKLSLKPKLVPNNNIEMDFKIETSQFLEVEERELNGSGPKVERRTESFRYRVQNGEAFLFGDHKITYPQDGQTKQKDLLVLIKAHTIDSSEQDKPARAENLVVTAPAIIPTRTERPNVNDQENTIAPTERRRRPARSTDDSLMKIIDNEKQVTKIFHLKYYDISQMTRTVSPLLTKTGHVTKDERTNSLIISDATENLKRIEKMIAQYDVSKADETVTEIFEIRNGDPVEIVEVLKKLINGRSDAASVIETSNGPILLIPEPQRKWIIAKASPENINQIGQWIKKLDTDKSTMGLNPMDKAVHEQLEMIVDLSELAPQMSFGEVVEILEHSVEPPLQIQPIWKDLLENAEVEQATPAGMDPLPHIKLRKALEILLTSVSSTGLPKLTYIVDEGVILIGTADVLPPKKVHRIDDTPDLLATDAAKASPENMLKIAEQIKEWDVPLDVDKIKPRIIELQNSEAEKMVELLKTLFTKEGEGALNIQDILIDRGIKVNQKIVGPLYEQLIFEEVPGTNKLIVISKIPEAYDVIEEFIFDLDRQNLSPENIKQIVQSKDKLDNRNNLGLDPIDKAVYEQLEMIVDLSELAPQMSFSEVVEILENSVEPPLQIQPIWKDLLDNAEVEPATPADMDPLPHIKLRKALEILLTSVSSTGLPKLSYIVDEGVILIGTADVLPPKIVPRAYDISDPNELRMITEHKQQPSQLQPKIAKLPDESKKRMTPLEQIQKQLDELIKPRQAPKITEPNVPLTPKVTLLSETFIDCPLIDALQYIATAANVNIIPDESIKGNVSIASCTLKDVTVETALDIILAGTPYVWKKTPHYYLVALGLERSKMVHRVYEISDLVFEPANYRMSGSRGMGGMGGVLMSDQGDYIKAQNLVRRIQETIEPDSWYGFSDTGEGTIMAYPIQSPRKLAVMQTHEVHQEIEKLLNAKRESLENQVSISIEGVFLRVSEDYLKYVGLDTNPEKFSDAWNEHLAATYPASPNDQTYGLILDDLQVRFLLKAVQADKDSKAIVAPRVHTREGTTAEMRFTTEEYNYISGYNEPQDPSIKPQPKREKVDIGTRIWLTPKLSDNKININIDLNLEMRQLEGIIEGKYKGKYPYYKPIIDVISAKMPCTIPKGRTMLVGGLKINEPIIKESGAPGLKDLPLIGTAFSSKDKARDQKMLLILVKPIINPQQKATKIRPGQEDSEEHIKHLAEQLDKKINPSGKPRQ